MPPLHIKQIKVNGFKSYKADVVIDLDPKVNVIVGRNGTGKSNVFDGT